MKKNRFMRLASCLLILCLITTCAISTTFAKYVSGDSASDTARVAKWGITVSTSGNLFGENYGAKDHATNADSITSTATMTVSTSEDDDIVAPGTKNAVGFQISVSGQPEVAYNVTVKSAADADKIATSEIYLKAGTYGVMVPVTGLNSESNVVGLYTESTGTYTKVESGSWVSGTTYYEVQNQVIVEGDGYYPIAWSVANTGTTSVAASGRLADIASTIENNLEGARVVGTEINAKYTLTWSWAHEVTGNSIVGVVDNVDNADTILGQLAVTGNKVVKIDGTTAEAPTLTDDYCLNLNFSIKVTVEQAD